MAKAFQVMTVNIIKVIDDKLSPLAETVRQHGEDIEACGWMRLGYLPRKIALRVMGAGSSNWRRRLVS